MSTWLKIKTTANTAPPVMRTTTKHLQSNIVLKKDAGFRMGTPDAKAVRSPKQK